MANNQNLKDAIAAVIKTNGNNEITGALLQSAILSVINQFGSGAIFSGVAIPSTSPSNNDVVSFYVANTNGIYSNFGGYELKNNDIVFFTNKTGGYQVEVELKNSIGRVNVANINTAIEPRPKIVDTTNNEYILEVSTDGSITRQYRTFPNIGGEPYLQYRDTDNSGVTWTPWVNVQALTQSNYAKIVGSSQFNSISEPGAYIYNVSSGRFDITVTKSGDILRAVRLFTNSGNSLPQLSYAEKSASANSWGEWKDLIFSIDGIINNLQLDTLNRGGVFKVDGINPYLVFSSISGGIARQMRLFPNFGDVPFWAYRDNYGEWERISSNNDVVQKTTATNEDIIWSWWTNPILARSVNPYNNIYVGYTDSQGNTGVFSKNTDSGAISKTNIKPIKTQTPDDHNAAAIIQLDDQYLLSAFPGGHNDDNMFYIYKSMQRGGNVDWREVLALNTGVLTSYAQIIYKDGSVYVFFRGRTLGVSWDWYMLKSEDNGETWTDKQLIFSNTNQWYIFFKEVLGSPDLIRMVHTANSTLGMPLKGAFLETTTNNILNADGVEVMGSVGSGVDPMLFSDIMPLAPGMYDRMLDVKVSDLLDWQILYCRYTTQSDGVYYHFDNGTVIEVVSAGLAFFNGSRYYGGGCFGEVGKIYTIRRNSGYSWVEEYELIEGVYNKTLEIDKTTLAALRPTYVDGVVAYHRGQYNNSYTNFSTELVIKEV